MPRHNSALSFRAVIHCHSEQQYIVILSKAKNLEQRVFTVILSKAKNLMLQILHSAYGFVQDDKRQTSSMVTRNVILSKAKNLFRRPSETASLDM